MLWAVRGGAALPAREGRVAAAVLSAAAMEVAPPPAPHAAPAAAPNAAPSEPGSPGAPEAAGGTCVSSRVTGQRPPCQTPGSTEC